MKELFELAQKYPIQYSVNNTKVQLDLKHMGTLLRVEVKAKAKYLLDCDMQKGPVDLIDLKIATLECVSEMYEKIVELNERVGV